MFFVFLFFLSLLLFHSLCFCHFLFLFSIDSKHIKQIIAVDRFDSIVYIFPHDHKKYYSIRRIESISKVLDMRHINIYTIYIFELRILFFFCFVSKDIDSARDFVFPPLLLRTFTYKITHLFISAEDWRFFPSYIFSYFFDFVGCWHSLLYFTYFVFIFEFFFHDFAIIAAIKFIFVKLSEVTVLILNFELWWSFVVLNQFDGTFSFGFLNKAKWWPTLVWMKWEIQKRCAFRQTQKTKLSFFCRLFIVKLLSHWAHGIQIWCGQLLLFCYIVLISRYSHIFWGIENVDKLASVSLVFVVSLISLTIHVTHHQLNCWTQSVWNTDFFFYRF